MFLEFWMSGATALLHATYHNKSSLTQDRYHSIKREKSEEMRMTVEDEIISTVIGPMDFMSASEVLGIWKAILAWNESVIEFPEGEPAGVKVFLWPNENNNGDRTNSQPDAKITFEWSDGQSLILILEAKWDAPLGENQLENQWNDFNCKPNTHHVFVGKTLTTENVKREIEKYNRSKSAPNQLISLTWMKIRQSLNEFSKMEGNSASRYAKYVECFLGAAGISRFNGFNTIKTPGFTSTELTFPLFHKLFHGFFEIECASKDSLNSLDGFIFYRISD